MYRAQVMRKKVSNRVFDEGAHHHLNTSRCTGGTVTWGFEGPRERGEVAWASQPITGNW